MVVFFYDKTLDGLLTAVFDAYSRKVFPDMLLSEGDVAPMFMAESYTVVTQEERAMRVWTALENKISKQACNMLTYTWLSDDDESANLLFRYIRKAIDSEISIETNFGDTDVLQVHKLARKVSHEQLYLKQFIRFQKAADGIFFASVSPIHNALPLIVEHFVDRFSDQRWLIYDVKRKYGYYYDLTTAVEVTLEDDNHLLGEKLDDDLIAEDEKLFQTLWKGYFKSITIKERINPRLQRQHMPKRFWKYLTEKQ